MKCGISRKGRVGRGQEDMISGHQSKWREQENRVKSEDSKREKGKERNNKNRTVKQKNVHLGPGKRREVCYISGKIKGDGGEYLQEDAEQTD